MYVSDNEAEFVGMIFKIHLQEIQNLKVIYSQKVVDLVRDGCREVKHFFNGYPLEGDSLLIPGALLNWFLFQDQ